MQETENQDINTQDELSVLKQRADLLGIKYHPSISAEKLKEKINAKLSDEQEEPEQASGPVPGESENARRLRKKREAEELVRIRVTCMNPAKKEWEGEIFTAGNSTVGTFKKYVPFNADDGWHVPRIIYNQIIQRQCQVFYSVKDERGNSIRKGKLIKEFAVEVLPPLTKEELQELARRQAMAKSVG